MSISHLLVVFSKLHHFTEETQRKESHVNALNYTECSKGDVAFILSKNLSFSVTANVHVDCFLLSYDNFYGGWLLTASPWETFKYRDTHSFLGSRDGQLLIFYCYYFSLYCLARLNTHKDLLYLKIIIKNERNFYWTASISIKDAVIVLSKSWIVSSKSNEDLQKLHLPWNK